MSSTAMLHDACGYPLSHLDAGTATEQPFLPSLRLVARSAAMLHVVAQMEHAMPHLSVAAIEGESGTGKSLVARELHAHGPAAEGPLVVMQAMAFDSDQIPTTGGMLLLERIDEMPSHRQAMLLHFLRCRDSFTLEPALTPLQVVVSCSRSLHSLVAAGRLLPDLAYRLTAVRFSLPPLRERHEDIPGLVKMFLDRFSRKYRKPIQGLAAGSLARLLAHPWKGNVRELQSVLESAALDVVGQWIRPIDLSLTPAAWARFADNPPSATSFPADMSLDTASRQHIATVMFHAGGNKKRAAQLLGISRSTLYRMLEPHA